MEQTLVELRKKCVVGFVGGSDLSKQVEQLGPNGKNPSVIEAATYSVVIVSIAPTLFNGRCC